MPATSLSATACASVLTAGFGAGVVEDAERLELDDDDDVAYGDGDEGVTLRLVDAVEPVHLRVGQRKEVALVGVQEVGRARPIALVGQLQGPLDLVTRRLDPDPLAAEVHH